MINEFICELVEYGLQQELIEAEDKIFVTNSLLELFQLTEYNSPEKGVDQGRFMKS